MLSLTIFLPLMTAVLILLFPSWSPRRTRRIALCGAFLTLVCTLILVVGFGDSPDLQWRTTLPWIPSIHASYDVAVDGVSLPLICLTALLLLLVTVYVLPRKDRARSHAVLFLLMSTGLMGLFSAQDLLLFYLFFEVGLVPMYFIIGGWGHEDRHYAAMKFFLYTRAGSLALLLSFLGLYFWSEPHTFSLPTLIETQPMAGATVPATLILLGMLIGFGVKLPLFPLHNWLPDAHVEAPTEGSVMLAGIQLKMGGYGLLRVLLPTVPDAAREWGWVITVVAVFSIIYGALAALAQSDLKRLIAYTSVNHMGFVLLGVGAFALSRDAAVRSLALTGATYQMISHGLLTGAMFFLVGMLGEQAGTREMARFGGLLRCAPFFGFLLAVLAFASFGLPGFSGFVAEFQILGATVSVTVAAALAAVVGLLITTGLYLRLVANVLLGDPPSDMPAISEPPSLKLAAVSVLAGLSLLLGLVPAPLVEIIRQAAQRISRVGI